MKKSIKASSIRSLLIFIIVLLFLAVAGGFYFAFEQVRTFAITVSHTVIDADASGKQIAELQSLKQELSESEQLVTKASKLFATPENYQSQALKDVQKYAGTYDINILNTKFESATDAVSTGNVFVITLESPVSYSNLLKFLDAIEGNLPKMQVNSIELGHVANNASDKVSTNEIKIGISTR